MGKKNVNRVMPEIIPAKSERNREAVLIGTTPQKLLEKIGPDTVILVSRKHLKSLVLAAASDKLLADL